MRCYGQKIFQCKVENLKKAGKKLGSQIFFHFFKFSTLHWKIFWFKDSTTAFSTLLPTRPYNNVTVAFSCCPLDPLKYLLSETLSWISRDPSSRANFQPKCIYKLRMSLLEYISTVSTNLSEIPGDLSEIFSEIVSEKSLGISGHRWRFVKTVERYSKSVIRSL